MIVKKLILKKIILCALILLMIPTIVCATDIREGHIKLLAVHQFGNETIGTTADLYLEISPGSGRVFLDTFPMTKIDTQISTRFAKSIACDFLEYDCEDYDFFYTIRADSSIIGGPSAGAAISALTAILLSETPYNNRISVTGTINSGGIIGPVGGVKEKIEAASRSEEIEKVIIPKAEIEIKEDNNTIDLVEFGKEKGIEVEGAATLKELLFSITGKNFRQEQSSLLVDDDYTKIMKSLALNLCKRADELRETTQEISKSKQNDSDYLSRLEAADNLTIRSVKDLGLGRFYAAASYCFSANVRYQQMIQSEKKLSLLEIMLEIDKLEAKIDNMTKEIGEKELSTISDLQTYMVVFERLGETREKLRLAREVNESKELYLAFAEERFYSAILWSEFFGMEGSEFVMDEASLKESCFSKIAEAEESYQYVNVFFPGILAESRADIDKAYRLSKDKEYIGCIAKAANAKANANAVLSVIGVTEEQAEEIIVEKLAASKEYIISQVEKGRFPILAYSYWEYGNSLKEHDSYSGLLYAEYALELSNLDLYLKKKKSSYKPEIELPAIYYWIFALGLSIGILLGIKIEKKRNPVNTKKLYKKKGNLSIRTKNQKTTLKKK